MPVRPTEPPPRRRSTDREPYPYETIAHRIRQQIESGELGEGMFLPGIKAIAVTHGVAAGTAHRAVALLSELGLTVVVPGRGTRVCHMTGNLPS